MNCVAIGFFNSTNVDGSLTGNLLPISFQMPVTIKNVHFYTLIQKAKFGIVRGMTEVSAGTDPRVDTDTYGEYCV